jgi:hypothetical protein
MKPNATLLTMIALVAVACGDGGDTPPPAPDGLALPEGAERAGASITPEALRTAVTRLASDEMEGRGPGTDGNRLAREYLVGQLERLGYEPAGPDGGWEQPLDIIGLK